MNDSKPVKEINTTPVFQRNLYAYQNNFSIICNEGGSRCFYPGQKIITIRGDVEISKLQENDIVFTFNEETKQNQWNAVKQIHKMANSKKSIEIKLRDGTVIKCTEDHKFYYEGGWVCIKDILSLWHDRNMETSTKVQQPV